MAGILTRDTINQPVMSYKCVSEVLQYEYQEFLGDEYTRFWVLGARHAAVSYTHLTLPTNLRV